MEFETKELRDATIALHGLTGLDDEYAFYYDETNNIRKFYLRESDFNESIKSNFILGGVLLEKGQSPDVKCFFESLGLNKTIQEVKMKHIAKGDFFESLENQKLNSIFDFILTNDLTIHYSSLNYLYYSIVDIVDSIQHAAGATIGYDHNRYLKNVFYRVVVDNKASFIPLFYKYGYPNVKRTEVHGFLEDLVTIFKREPKNVWNDTILMLLDRSKQTSDLVFIMDEKDHILIDSFLQFYLRTIFLFTKSHHCFDREDAIQPILESLKPTYEGKELVNYRFLDSCHEPMIQLSDIIVGFLGKLYKYIDNKKAEEIQLDLMGLGDDQRQTLGKFNELLSNSLAKNEAFIFRSESMDDIEKINLIITG